MRYLGRLTTAALIIAVATTTGRALTGRDGHTATMVFTDVEAQALIEYDVEGSAVPWSSMDRWFSLGSAASRMPHDPDIATAADGTVFLIVHAARDSEPDVDYFGVVSFDGAELRHVMQTSFDHRAAVGERIEAITVSPVTMGRLRAGEPVVTVVRIDDPGDPSAWASDVLSLDRSTSPATVRVVHSFPATRARHVTVDDDGSLFVSILGRDGEIRRLDWTGAAYAETVLADGLDGTIGHVADPAGSLYAFEQGARWGGGRGGNVVLRIDPTDGATTPFGQASRKDLFNGWTTDGLGHIWIALGSPSKDKVVITHVESGSLARASGGVGESTEWAGQLRTLQGHDDGTLYVLEWSADNFPSIELWLLTPGTADSGSGGSGGKGGGKGRSK